MYGARARSSDNHPAPDRGGQRTAGRPVPPRASPGARFPGFRSAPRSGRPSVPPAVTTEGITPPPSRPSHRAARGCRRRHGRDGAEPGRADMTIRAIPPSCDLDQAAPIGHGQEAMSKLKALVEVDLKRSQHRSDPDIMAPRSAFHSSGGEPFGMAMFRVGHFECAPGKAQKCRSGAGSRASGDRER